MKQQSFTAMILRGVWLLFPAGLLCLFAQTASGQDQDTIQRLLSENCEQAGLDNCYRDAGNRIIRLILRPQMLEVATTSERQLIQSIDFMVFADRDVLRMKALMNGTKRVIEISSGALIMLHSMGTAAILDGIRRASGLDEYGAYVERVVRVLDGNRRRRQMGQSAIATPTYREILNMSAAREKQLMGTDAARAMSMLFFQIQSAWVLAHEVGHHALGHTLIDPRTKQPKDRRQMEADADSFATNLVSRMGYSIYPMLYGMIYFGGIEAIIDEGEADKTHPPVGCRLASVLEEGSGLFRRQRHSRDDLNKDLSERLLAPQTRDVIKNLRAVTDGC